MENSEANVWKKLGAWLLMGLGGILALAAWSGTSGPTVLLMDLVFWPVDRAQSLTPESQLLATVLGGVMVGWGVMVLLLIARVYPFDPGLVRSVILPGVWVWFVLDSTGSLIVGAPTNVELNIGAFLAFVLPWQRVSVT